MQRFADLSGEVVSLAVLDGFDVRLVLRTAAAGIAGGPVAGAGTLLRPAHCTALGKALLAFQPPAVRAKAVAELPLDAFTANTLTDRAAFARDLDFVRRRRFALDRNEIIEGVSCVAVPILDGQGLVVGALSTSAPSLRLPPERIETVTDQLRATVQRITNLLLLMRNRLRRQRLHHRRSRSRQAETADPPGPRLQVDEDPLRDDQGL